MYISTFGAIALGMIAVDAFRDTSPFFFYSTSEVLAPFPEIASAASLSKQIKPELAKCLSDTYVIISQPGVSAADYSSQFSAPHLRNAMSGDDKQVRSSFTVTDVLGTLDSSALMDTVKERCGAAVLSVDASTGSFDVIDDMKPRVIRLDFPALPAGPRRANQLSDNDAFLASMLNTLPSSNYTVLYTTSSVSADHQPLMTESRVYEMENTFSPSLHMDLKRDLSMGKRASGDNITLVDGPLFERYQFFTPGIFMGLLIGLLLLVILYVGISGLSSLQVSYAAFDKENGPAAQKKQQQ